VARRAVPRRRGRGGSSVAASLGGHVSRHGLDVAGHADHDRGAPGSRLAARGGAHGRRRRGARVRGRGRDVRGAAAAPACLADALWDLVGRGLVAGDGFQPLRDLLAGGRSARSGRRAAQGRWSLFERAEPPGSGEGPTLPDAIADRVAQQLLARYGVVFRELVARESFAVPWRDVLRALRLLEARGLVRGGRFVAGFIGEQYALPEALEGLRRIRRTERTGEVVRVRASDPLNLVGILLPGPRIPSQ